MTSHNRARLTSSQCDTNTRTWIWKHDFPNILPYQSRWVVLVMDTPILHAFAAQRYLPIFTQQEHRMRNPCRLPTGRRVLTQRIETATFSRQLNLMIRRGNRAQHSSNKSYNSIFSCLLASPCNQAQLPPPLCRFNPRLKCHHKLTQVWMMTLDTPMLMMTITFPRSA